MIYCITAQRLLQYQQAVICCTTATVEGLDCVYLLLMKCSYTFLLLWCSTSFSMHGHITLFCEQNSGQLGSVAQHIDVCFQARKQHTRSDESQLAPYPGLYRKRKRKSMTCSKHCLVPLSPHKTCSIIRLCIAGRKAPSWSARA